MRAVDTNVLVRLATRDDPRQLAAAEAFIEPGAWVSVLALAEAAWVLGSTYDRDPRRISAALQMMLDHKQLFVQDYELVVAALELFHSRPALGFADCLLIETARSAGHLPFGTFDRDLAKVEGAVRL
jgi:predicted nucleic acid-binding protein